MSAEHRWKRFGFWFSSTSIIVALFIVAQFNPEDLNHQEGEGVFQEVVDSRMKNEINSLRSRFGVRYSVILVVISNTNLGRPYAAIAGLRDRNNGDTILAITLNQEGYDVARRLGEKELRALLAHEIGHYVMRDPRIFNPRDSTISPCEMGLQEVYADAFAEAVTGREALFNFLAALRLPPNVLEDRLRLLNLFYRNPEALRALCYGERDFGPRA